MIERNKIQTFVEEVVRQFHPKRVVLFGSHAYGTPNEDSDVDLLVIMPHQEHSASQAAEILKRVRAGFPVDLIVRSPQTIRQRLRMDDSFITEILERGQVLHEARSLPGGNQT